MRFIPFALLGLSSLIVVACGGAAAGEASPTSSSSSSPSTTAVTATQTAPPATATASATPSSTAEATATATSEPPTATSTATSVPPTPVPPTPTATEAPPTPTPTPPPASLTVQVTVVNGSSFSPNRLTIAVGDTVTWSWSGDVMHNVASTTAGFESDYAKTGTFSFTFNSTGTYYYLCEVHPTVMKGVVQVD